MNRYKLSGMKRIFCLLAGMLLVTACNDEVRITVYEDMMYFLSEEPDAGYVSPATDLTAEAPSRLDLYVARNPYAAREHPGQTAWIVVDETSSAVPDTDFKLGCREFAFGGREELKLPFQLQIRSSASGKRIVLRLDYGYTDECRPEYRKADRLVVEVR